MPSIRSTVYKFRSMGFPVSSDEADSVPACPMPNTASHLDTSRDPRIHTHTTGIHKPLDVRTLRSRSSAKSPTIPRMQTNVAICGGITTTLQGFLTNGAESSRVEE